jgi:predicted acylesterase/phospholipase RssA
MKTALVISGGGCKGAFAIGAIEWLLEKGESFDILIGTSTGALIVPLVASGDFHIVKKIYSNVRTKDLLRKNCCLTLPWRASLYNDSGLKNIINTNLTPFIFYKLRQSSKGVYVCTVNLNSGSICYWSPKMMCVNEFRRALLASSNEPGFMPPVQIFEGGDYHLDGGIREVVPIQAAIDCGAKRIFAIKLSPPTVTRNKEKYNRIPSTLFRSLDLMVTEIRNNDIDSVMCDDIDLIIIEPEKELTKNSLKFVPEEMRAMMKIGYDRAKEVFS